MTSSLTNLSAFTLSFNGSPYPLPNFNFAYAAGPDGRQFLQEGVTQYYQANPSEALTIFQDIAGINQQTDPLFLVGQDLVGFPEAGLPASAAYPNLYYYESQIGSFPGALEANLSFQALKNYIFQQASAINVEFSESEKSLIEKGFDAVIARYASVLQDGNLMKTGSNLNGSGEGKDYVDVWAEIAGLDAKAFYNVAGSFPKLSESANGNVVSEERFDVYGKIYRKATEKGSDYLNFYQGNGGHSIGDFDVYSSPTANFDIDSSSPPTVLQTLLADFKELVASGDYNGTFADGGLKIESGVRSLLSAGLDANPLFTGQGYGYSSNGSPTSALGLNEQSILERIPGYEFTAFNTFVNQYASPTTTIRSTSAAQGETSPTGVSPLSDGFVGGNGFFPEGSAALTYDAFSEWNLEVITPQDKFVSKNLFPTPENESLEAVQFFQVEFIDAGLYLDMPETPVSTRIILSSNDVSGDIDEEFAPNQDGPMIQDISLGLGQGFSNFAGTSVGDDIVMGGDLNDFIATQDGNDKVMGMDGNDLINTGAGYDIAFLGGGSDTILVRHQSMKGELAPVSYLTLPDFSSEDSIVLEDGIGFEVIDDLRLRLTFENYEKILVLSGSSTLTADGLGVMSSSIGWQDIIDMGQIQTI